MGAVGGGGVCQILADTDVGGGGQVKTRFYCYKVYGKDIYIVMFHTLCLHRGTSFGCIQSPHF